MSVTKDYSETISKIVTPQYFIQYKNDIQTIFTTDSQKIETYVHSKASGQNMSSFIATLTGLPEENVQKIGDFTVVKTKDYGKYSKIE